MRIGRVAPWVATVVAFVSTGAARAQDPASDLSGYLTLASGYWKHGVSHVDGASLQQSRKQLEIESELLDAIA